MLARYIDLQETKGHTTCLPLMRQAEHSIIMRGPNLSVVSVLWQIRHWSQASTSSRKLCKSAMMPAVLNVQGGCSSCEGPSNHTSANIDDHKLS